MRDSDRRNAETYMQEIKRTIEHLEGTFFSVANQLKSALEGLRPSSNSSEVDRGREREDSSGDNLYESRSRPRRLGDYPLLLEKRYGRCGLIGLKRLLIHRNGATKRDWIKCFPNYRVWHGNLFLANYPIQSDLTAKFSVRNWKIGLELSRQAQLLGYSSVAESRKMGKL